MLQFYIQKFIILGSILFLQLLIIRESHGKTNLNGESRSHEEVLCY